MNILFYQLTSKKIYKDQIDAWKMRILETKKTPNGLLFFQKWGSVRHALNTSFLLSFLDNKFIALAKSQLDYVLGASSNGPLINGAFGSLVVGIGTNFPNTAHHRASFCCGNIQKTGFSKPIFSPVVSETYWKPNLRTLVGISFTIQKNPIVTFYTEQ